LERAIRVLVVDDYDPWRRFVSSTLAKRPGLEIIGEIADGLEAVHKAHALQPDLILLDIGLPTLDGIKAARQIRERSRKSKILFASVERSPEIVKEALGTGAMGYVFKLDAANDLLPAVEAVLQGKQFVSASRKSQEFTDSMDSQAGSDRQSPTLSLPQKTESAPRHKAGFYSDDPSLLDHLTQLVGAAFNAGSTVIVIASESHRDGLIRRLRAQDAEIEAAIERGRYIALDAADLLSAFLQKGMPDRARFLEFFRNLVEKTAQAEKGRPAHVTIFGECAPLLCAEGNPRAAILMERFVNQLVKELNVDILCMYSLGSLQGRMDADLFARICAEHPTVFSR